MLAGYPTSLRFSGWAWRFDLCPEFSLPTSPTWPLAAA
jgi:hypothetical protein